MALYQLSVEFDEHILAVTSSGADWTVSGSTVLAGSTSDTFTVFLDAGYIIDSVSVSEGFTASDITQNSFYASYASGGTITITSKQTGGATMKSYDLSTSSEWANLADGEHQVTIVAKGTGYRDSTPSTPVTITK